MNSTALKEKVFSIVDFAFDGEIVFNAKVTDLAKHFFDCCECRFAIMLDTAACEREVVVGIFVIGQIDIDQAVKHAKRLDLFVTAAVVNDGNRGTIKG